MQETNGIRRSAVTILSLFAPLFVSQCAQMANAVIDTAMAGGLGTPELGAVCVGSALWTPVFTFVAGLLHGLLVLVARSHGAARREEVLRLGWDGLWAGLALGTAAALCVYACVFDFSWLETDPELREHARRYLLALLPGIPFAGLALSVRFFLEGQSITKPVTVCSIIAIGINATLNYGLMFGQLGMPCLGLAGCGAATAASMVSGFVMLTAYSILSPHLASRRLPVRLCLPSWGTLKMILRIGLPVGIAIGLECHVFAAITYFVSRSGPAAAAAHQTAVSCTMFCLTAPAALSMAASIRISTLRGRNDLEEAFRTAKAVIVLASGLGLLSGLCLSAIPGQVILFFSSDPDVTPLATALIRIAGLFQILMAIQVCLNGILRGLGDTVFPFMATSAVYWMFCLPLGYLLSGMPLPFGSGVYAGALGIAGWWAAFALSLILVTGLLAYRARKQFHPCSAMLDPARLEHERESRAILP